MLKTGSVWGRLQYSDALTRISYDDQWAGYQFKSSFFSVIFFICRTFKFSHTRYIRIILCHKLYIIISCVNIVVIKRKISQSKHKILSHLILSRFHHKF